MVYLYVQKPLNKLRANLRIPQDFLEHAIVHKSQFVNRFWFENAFCHRNSHKSVFEKKRIRVRPITNVLLILIHIYFQKNSIFGNVKQKKSEFSKKNRFVRISISLFLLVSTKIDFFFRLLLAFSIFVFF